MSYDNWFSLIASVLGILGSIIVAKIVAKSEFKKLTAQQNHEIRLNAIQAFSKMKGAVNTYTSTPNTKFKREALTSIGEFTPYASEKLLVICESLENAVNSEQPKIASDFMNRLSSEWLSEKPSTQNHNKTLKCSK